MRRHKERAVIVALGAVICALVVWGPDGAPSGVATTSTTDAGHLAADEVGSAVSATGHLTEPLAPGRGEAIDLRLSNLTDRAVRLESVTVSIHAVRRPGGRPPACDSQDFALRQGDMGGGVLLAAGGDVRLSETGLDRSRWPHLRMVDHDHNQDGCKGAVVRLAFDARGSAA